MGLIIQQFVISFLLCVALTPLVRWIAVKKGWIAVPSTERWHQKPTARSGGIAIYASIAIPLLITTKFSDLLINFVEASDPFHLKSVDAVIWIGMTFVFFLGLIDDFQRLKPQTKLLGQIIVASFVAFLGFRLRWFESLTIDTMVTIIWIVGITNAFNLIDNMDGLCAGIGLIAAISFAILFGLNRPESFQICVLLSGALSAFLIYNFKPASIFMGDCGSMVIGFVMAMTGLHYSETIPTPSFFAKAVPVIILIVPILDTTLVSIIRILSGRKASTGGKDHTSHRLVLVGLSEIGSVSFLYMVGIISGVAGVFVSMSDSLTSPAVMIPLGLSLMLMGIYLAQIRVYPEKEFSLLRDHSYTPILLELTYKRQIILVALDFCLVAFSYYLSYRIRFGVEEFIFYFRVFLHSLPIIIICKLTAFYAAGIYRGFWTFISTNDVLTYLKATIIGSILSISTATYIYRFEYFSKGVFLIDWLLTTGLLLGTRGSFRMFQESMKRKSLSGDTVLIYGAGRGGELLLREILNNEQLHYKPIGFIDDDPLKVGKNLQGFPILGTYKDIDSLLSKYPVNGLLISFNHKNRNLNDIIEYCDQKGLFLKRFSISITPIENQIS